jgi:hypothetical protein
MFKLWQRSAEIIVLYVHHHHGGVLGGEGAVNEDIECCDVGCGSGDVARVVESVAADGQPDSFLFFLVRFVITDYFPLSDFSVFRDVGENMCWFQEYRESLGTGARIRCQSLVSKVAVNGGPS